jgi:predicted DNA binding protein
VAPLTNARTVGRSGPTAESLLTDRQREAVEAANDLGYYEIPREASQEDVAERIGCAASTAAEHLRKAETKLLRSIL